MIEKKLYTTIFHALFPHRSTIRLYTDSKQKKDLFSQIDHIILTDKEHADILLIGNENQLVKDKLVFVYTYRAFKYYNKIAIGGLYWKKGRPNLIFQEKNLKKHRITLPSSMKKYIY